MSEVPSGPELPSKWSTRLLRFTIFTKNWDEVPSGDTAFKAFFGFDHKQRIENAPDLTEIFTSHDGSTFIDVLSHVVRSPSKIDFEMQASINAEIRDNEFQSFSEHSCDALLERFKASSAAFLESLHSSGVLRIAVGAEHFISASDRAEGYRILGQKLKSVTLRPDVSNEFLYQINYWADRSIDNQECRINRLTTWSCGAHNISFSGADGEAKAKILSFARLQTDVNSIGSFDTSLLTPSGQKELLAQLFELTAEIIEKGEPDVN